MIDYKELLKEARDLLVLCTMLDKSDHCQNMVNKIDRALQQPGVMPSLPSVHQCRYSKAMNQPYPRKCVDCGKPEDNVA